jgi:hypothetical protein
MTVYGRMPECIQFSPQRVHIRRREQFTVQYLQFTCQFYPTILCVEVVFPVTFCTADMHSVDLLKGWLSHTVYILSPGADEFVGPAGAGVQT